MNRTEAEAWVRYRCFTQFADEGGVRTYEVVDNLDPYEGHAIRGSYTDEAEANTENEQNVARHLAAIPYEPDPIVIEEQV
jgi:hypothetical protein